MALPPGGLSETPDADRKRLLQRADSFAIGKGARESEDSDEADEFDEALESVGKVKSTAEQVEDSGQVAEKLESHRDDQAVDEAERRGSSSPSHQPFLGLTVLPGIKNPETLIQEAQRNEAKDSAKGVDGNHDLDIPSVSPEILNALKTSGLERPVVNLDDPRLGPHAGELSKDFVMSLADGARVYVWSRPDCHQKIVIGMTSNSLESAAGDTVEVLNRNNGQDQKRVLHRKSQETDFPPL